MNKELPYHTSNIVQRYLQLKKIAHYESGVIISIVISLFLLSLVFMGSHIGTSFSSDPVEFTSSTEGGGIKVLGIQKGGNDVYGSLYPYLLLGKVEQIRGIWSSENNVMLLGDVSGTALPRYVSSQYVFPRSGNWTDQEYEQYLQAISASSISPIQQLGIKEDLNREDISSNFSCLGRSWTPSYFCKDKLPELVDIIPRFVVDQRKSAYQTLYDHIDDPQYQPVCNKLLQTIVLKRDYFEETKKLIDVCNDKSLSAMYESAKLIQGFHAFIDKPEVVMSFAGIKDPIIQHYVIVTLIQDILQGISSDRDNVVLLESFALTIDSLEGQKNIDKNYLGLLSYFNKSKLQPYFTAKVGATINQRETYDRVTASFKNFDKVYGGIPLVTVNTGSVITGSQFDWNSAIQKATGLTPDRMITTDQKITTLFLLSGKRYIMSIGLTSGNLIELYRSEPGVGNTKIDTSGITFELQNYPNIARIFSNLQGNGGSTELPKTQADWKRSFESNIGPYDPQVVIRGEAIVMAFSKSSKKFAIVVNLTVNQIKLYQVTENEGNKLISTLNGGWSGESFTVIKSKLN